MIFNRGNTWCECSYLCLDSWLFFVVLVCVGGGVHVCMCACVRVCMCLCLDVGVFPGGGGAEGGGEKY